MKQFLILFFMVGTFTLCLAQQTPFDPILFSVDEVNVPISEFDYIYTKNNGDQADYSQASLEEYLDLYIKFKLKVLKARQMKLDTLEALKKELAGYRKQLASSYLADKELTSKLVDEVFQRKQWDLRVSHILLNCDENASKDKVDEVLTRAESIRNKLAEGNSFKLMAQTLSEDQATATNGGNLGWLTAILPDGFYGFENAIYSMEIGDVSIPIRSSVGFHIIKLTDKRKARGEMEVGHILIRSRKKGQYVAGSKEKIDSIHQMLLKGESFEKLAKLHSEDKNTSPKGGRLGFFGISQYDVLFENAAFELKKDHDFSEPFQTSLGWHIVKRYSKKNYSDEKMMKKLLTSQISRSNRIEISKKSMIEKIKHENQFQLNSDQLEGFINTLDESFFSFTWKIPELENATLFDFNDRLKYSLQDFAQYCKTNARQRMRFSNQMPVEQAVKSLLDTYIDEKTLAFEEANLEEKYPDFKSLMREYSEGILLFEATKINVWDKAPKDTTGLLRFYEEHKDQYWWEERAVIHRFTIYSKDMELISSIWNAVKKKRVTEVLEEFNTNEELIVLEKTIHEKGSKEMEDMNWEIGTTSRPDMDLVNSRTIIKKIDEIIPPRQKSINEARGYIIADYQDKLEKEWIEQLKDEFTVHVNEDVLNSMIKMQ